MTTGLTIVNWASANNTSGCTTDAAVRVDCGDPFSLQIGCESRAYLCLFLSHGCAGAVKHIETSAGVGIMRPHIDSSPHSVYDGFMAELTRHLSAEGLTEPKSIRNVVIPTPLTSPMLWLDSKGTAMGGADSEIA